MSGYGYAPCAGLLVDPHGCEALFDVFKVEEEAEEELVAEDCPTRDDKREWEGDSVI